MLVCNFIVIEILVFTGISWVYYHILMIVFPKMSEMEKLSNCIIYFGKSIIKVLEILVLPTPLPGFLNEFRKIMKTLFAKKVYLLRNSELL